MDNIRNELGKLRNEVWHILQLDYSKRTDFIPSILGRIDGILEAPKRNCDVGTAEEQAKRFKNYCKSKACKRNVCHSCGYEELFHHECFPIWSQLPYESEVK